MPCRAHSVFGSIPRGAGEIRIHPKNIGALVCRSWTYYYKGQYSLALQDNDKVLESAAAPYWSYIRPAYVHLALGQYELAIAEAECAIDANPDLAVAYKMKGWSQTRLGKLDEAAAALDRAVMIDGNGAKPEDVYWSCFLRGGLHRERGDRDKALADFGEALKAFDESFGLNPALDIWEALTITITNGYLGNHERARQEYAKALELIERWPIDNNQELLRLHDEAKSLLEMSQTREENETDD